jgi:hypothetical protein
MEPVPKLNRHAAYTVKMRLHAFWAVLKAHFSPQAEDDLARAEEQHRGKNEPAEGV